MVIVATFLIFFYTLSISIRTVVERGVYVIVAAALFPTPRIPWFLHHMAVLSTHLTKIPDINIRAQHFIFNLIIIRLL